MARTSAPSAARRSVCLGRGRVPARRGAVGANVSGRGRGIGARCCASADLRRGVRGSARRTSAPSAVRRIRGVARFHVRWRCLCVRFARRVRGASAARPGRTSAPSAYSRRGEATFAPQRKAARFLIVFCVKRGGGGGRGAATSPGSSPRPI